MQHAPTPLGPGQPLARYLGKYFGKYFVLSTKSTLSSGPSVAFVSLGSSVAFVRSCQNQLANNVLCLAAHGGVRKEGWPPLQPSVSHTQRLVQDHHDVLCPPGSRSRHMPNCPSPKRTSYFGLSILSALYVPYGLARRVVWGGECACCVMSNYVRCVCMLNLRVLIYGRL